MKYANETDVDGHPLEPGEVVAVMRAFGPGPDISLLLELTAVEPSNTVVSGRVLRMYGSEALRMFELGQHVDINTSKISVREARKILTAAPARGAATHA